MAASFHSSAWNRESRWDIPDVAEEFAVGAIAEGVRIVDPDAVRQTKDGEVARLLAGDLP